MLPDSRGFLWISTQNGLNRFDGSVCRTYKSYNSTIKGAFTSNLIEDQNSDLWFTSETGLNHYVRKNDTFENMDFFKDGKENQYLPLYVDNLNRLWVVVMGKGIFVYSHSDKKLKFITKKYSNYVKISPIPFQKVSKIFYSGSESGLNILTVKDDRILSEKSFFKGINQPALNLARYFFIENDSLVWLTHNNYGLIKFNIITQKFRTYTNFESQKIEQLTSVTFRPNSNQLFVGSNQFGILVFDKKQEKFIQQFRQNFTNPKSITADWVEDILIDKQQNLFVNVMGFGIDFTNLNASNTEHWLNKDDIKKYHLGSNWVANTWLHKNKIFIKFQVNAERSPVVILDAKGTLIEQLKDYPGGSGFTYTTDSTLLDWGKGEILLLDDNFKIKKRIPVVTKSGIAETLYYVAVISPTEWFVSSESTNFTVTKNGSKYIVTENEELKKLNLTISQPMYYHQNTKQLFISSNWWHEFNILKKHNGKWENQPLKNLNASVFTIVPDLKDKSKLWLCTNKGLWKFDTKTYHFDIWDEAKGLPDNAVTNFLPEANGDFWLISNRGISFYNKKRNSFKNFTTKDGATSSEYWGGDFKLPDGRMLLPGTDGITVIDPRKINTDTPSNLFLTDLKVNEKSLKSEMYVGESSEINLRPNQNSFSLDFVGIDYANPERIKLQYQLQNFDNEWITTKNPATVHFSNVPEGNYNFRFRSLSDNGEITAQKVLKLNIAAPFWRTWWFRLIMFAVVLGIIYAFYRYRINDILKMQAVRNRISTDLHDEIGATLSGIGILSTIAKQQVAVNHPAYNLLGRITDDALTVGNSIDDIVWSINPKNDELNSIIARMRRHAAELFEAKGIDYQIITPEKIEDIKLSMEQRRDVFLIFKEAVNNLLKYANCTHVLIEIGTKNSHFKLKISDNGVGFDCSKESTRNGIKNMKNRAEKLNGKLNIDSEIQKGTKIGLEFPL
jgi:Y_Y_Y domain/Histidine kinase